MANLSSSQRSNMSHSNFAVPSKAPGSGSYPIPNKAHAANALARSLGKPVAGQVQAAVNKKFPNMGDAKKAANKSAMMKRAQG